MVSPGRANGTSTAHAFEEDSKDRDSPVSKKMRVSREVNHLYRLNLPFELSSDTTSSISWPFSSGEV